MKQKKGLQYFCVSALVRVTYISHTGAKGGMSVWAQNRAIWLFSAAEVDDTNPMSPNFFINIQAIKDSSKYLFDKISENSPKFENLSKI